MPSGWRAASCSGALNPLCHNGFQAARTARCMKPKGGGRLESAGEFASGEVFLPIKLLLMPLAISIAFAIMHYRIAGYL